MDIVLFLSLAELAFGMSVVHCFIPRRALGPGFGKSISAMVFFALLFAVLLAHRLLPPADYLLLFAIRLFGGIALALLFAYFVLMNYPRGAEDEVDERGEPIPPEARVSPAVIARWDRIQRTIYAVATAAQALVLVAAARLLAHHFYQIGSSGDLGPSVAALTLALVVGLFTTALMLGTVTMAMLIGHWYLVDPKIDIKWLKNACIAFGAAIGLKLVSIMISLMVGAFGNPFGPQGFIDEVLIDPIAIVFIAARVVVGLMIAGALCVMAYKAAAIRSTQSSTGILLPAMICVILGEMIGSYLIIGFSGLAV